MKDKEDLVELCIGECPVCTLDSEAGHPMVTRERYHEIFKRQQIATRNFMNDLPKITRGIPRQPSGSELNNLIDWDKLNQAQKQAQKDKDNKQDN